MSGTYQAQAPTRREVESLRGAAVLEFGTNWCGYCRAAQPIIASAMERFPDVPHVKIEDGKGRALGRHYRVKLWPTLIILKDGQEVARLVRPAEPEAIIEALAKSR